MMHYMKKSWVVGPLSETHSPMKFSVGKAKYSLIIASIIVMTTLFWIHNVPKLVGHTDNSSNEISSPISASSLPFTTNFFSSSSSKNYFLSPSSAPIASSSSSFSSSSSPLIFSPSSSSSSSPSSSSSSSSSSSFSPSTSDIPTVSSSRIPPQEEWQVQYNRDELAQIALTTRLLKSPDASVRSNLTTPKLTIIISSSPRNFEERHVIRQTWGGWLKEHGQQVFFIIGVPKSSLINGINMQSIDQESATYRDLIQYDFVDSYQNLTLKTVFTVRFFNEEILNLRKPAESWKSSPVNLIHPQLKSTSNEPRYMMKADDDIVINPANLLRWIEFLAKLENHSDRGIIMGKLYKTNKPVRDPNHKYYMPREVYPLDVFPHFVQGSGYLFSRNVARSLWITLTHLKRCFYFASEDNFLTGMCAPKAVKMINDYVYNEDERMQIDILHNPEFKFVKFFENPGINPDFCSYISPFLTVFGHGLRPSQLIEIWQKMNSPQETFERCIKNIDMNSQYEAYKLLS